MASLHLFNPENDLALAAGNASFTPPAGALAVRHAAEPLPLWWAEAGDAVLVSGPEIAEKAMRIKSMYNLNGEIVSKAPIGLHPDPWGWSAYTCRLFEDAGVACDMLPSNSEIESIRALSHRRTAIEIHRRLSTHESRMPIEALTVQDAMQAVDRWGNAVVKLPWSSSGRGVIYSNAAPRSTFENYVRGMIRRQGSVTVEPRYNRLLDFAMLFHAGDNNVIYRGLSMFATDGRGFYNGNLIASQKQIARQIGSGYKEFIKPLEEALTDIAGKLYSGWIGVDMLVYESGGKKLIAPCIEVNMRRTMGVAAMHIAEKLKPCRPMVLRVSPSGIELSL